MWLAEPLYDVIIRGAMLIDINSWKRSLQAYGIRTREIWWTDRRVIDHVYLCLVTGYWSCLPVSCDRLLIMFTCVLLRQPRHSYVCVRVLAMAISPHRLHTWTWYGSDASNRRSLRNWAAPWAIWQSRSISPNRRPPSLRQTGETDRWVRWIRQTGELDGCVCVSLTVIVPPLAACWGSGLGRGPSSGSYHPPCASDADNKSVQWRSETSASSPWTHYTEPDHRSIVLKTLKVGQFTGFWI